MYYCLPFFLATIALFFSPFSMASKPADTKFWLLQVSWDMQCSVVPSSSTPSIFIVDNGQALIENHGFSYNIMWALAKSKGSTITVTIKSKKAIVWGQCKKAITYPVKADKKLYFLYDMYFRYNKNNKKCYCKTFLHDQLDYIPPP